MLLNTILYNSTEYRFINYLGKSMCKFNIFKRNYAGNNHELVKASSKFINETVPGSNFHINKNIVIPNFNANKILFTPTYAYPLSSKSLPHISCIIKHPITFRPRIDNSDKFKIPENNLALIELVNIKDPINKHTIALTLFNKFIEKIKYLLQIVLEWLLNNYKNNNDILENGKKVLEIINMIIKNNSLSPEKYPSPFSRDNQEYQRFLNHNETSSDELIIKLKDLYKRENISVCYTIENYNHEIERYKKSLEILKTYPDKLTEIDYLEIFRRIGIMQNPDAIYFNELSDIKFSPKSKMVTVQGGEGLKLDHIVFDLITKHSLFKKETEYLSTLPENLNRLINSILL